MTNKIQLRRDTAANWTRVNPILDDGEPGLNITTNQIKYGDGSTAWNDLPYASGGGGLSDRLIKDSYSVILGDDGILTLPFGSTINDTPAAPGNGNGQAVEIKPGGVSHNNQLLRIYPTVPGPDGNHLHLTSGDLSVTDLFLGDDDQFVQIAVDGKVCIGTDNASNIWQFGTDGGLTLPGNFYIGQGEGSLAMISPDAVAIMADGGDTNQLWLFGTDGSLTLPSGGTILDTVPTPGITRTKYTGSAAYDVNWYSTASVIETGIVTTISEDYSGEADYSFQYAGYFKAPVTGTYTFTMFADDSGRFWIGPNALTGYTAGNANISIPMYASGTTTTSLTANEFYPIRLQINNDSGPGYLSFSWSNDQGQANTSVLTGVVFADLGHTAITSDNDIELKTNNGTTRTWRFGTDGDLTLPSGLVFDRAHTSIRVGQGFHIASGEGVNIKAIDETDPDNLIYKDWYFGTDGSLTFPDTTIQTTAFNITKFGDGFSLDGNNKVVTRKLYSTDPSNPSTHYRLELTTGGTIKLPDSSEIIGSTLKGIHGTGELNYTGLTIGPSSGNSENTWMYVDAYDAYIATDYANNAYTWKFDRNGSLTFPDTTIQTTAYKRTTGSWTVATGSDTYSFTVPLNGTYSMWVKGAIDNGIIVWNATATVTNNNVPVIGQQFAWNYTGGGTPIEITAIPTQFIGTANTIVSSNPGSIGSTTNTFDFVINNTSGSAKTVYWGYVTQ